ncbi:hypothetical protein [uncultured Schumannella sp.]|uniref:hypothetical protein n=1 Tax=uncultured Schumannella sp. TaxID=1195956 RepID=UPI0025E15C1F|nr:hypothetical protein [uncultured Schumannella sp.]
MFRHPLEPQVLASLATDHPLHGYDLRQLSDDRLADAAARSLLVSHEQLAAHPDYSVAANQEHANLAGSLLRRVTRILVQRTRVLHLSETGSPNLETQDELLEATTLAFIHMAGAFDALAIINGLLCGQTQFNRMAWQMTDFQKVMREHSPVAMSLLEPNAAGGRYLAAVLAFRNTVHRRMPDTGTFGQADGDPALPHAVLTLDKQSHDAIFTTFEKAGWTRFVGIELVGEYLWVRPSTLVGLLLNDGIPLLNAVADVTQAESLGQRHYSLDPDAGLYPRQMRDYAVSYLGLGHLRGSSESEKP